MLKRLEEQYHRFKDIETLMTDPDVVQDIDRYTKLNKEYSDLKELADAYLQLSELYDDLETAREMKSSDDKEMKSYGEEMEKKLTDQIEELEEKLKKLFLVTDPLDKADVYLEIRSGTGGDEASIFAGDIFRMYTKYTEAKGWKIEVMDVNEGTVGGYNKIIVKISGKNVYGHLKYESGAHRVQRVPKTESQGRVHTSAATVAVIPILELQDVEVNKADIKVDTFRSSGAGGQHVNKTESGVRFTHLPTGTVAESTDSRSQLKNREIALQRLITKIRQEQVKRQKKEAASRRRELVGTGDRSDKIRTYNFPQNRFTDHRIGLTLYNLDKVITGELEEIIEQLQVADREEVES